MPPGQVTENEADIQKSIEYKELTLKLIQSQPNYPFGASNDLDDIINEKEAYVYLGTAGDLAGSYMNLYAVRSMSHIKSTNQDVGNTTLEPLYQAIDAANRCLSIPYKPDVLEQKGI